MVKVNIELEEGIKTYEFPESWDEVNVEQFCNLYKFNGDEINELEASIRLLSALSGIERNILDMMDIDDFKKLIENLKFISKELNKVDVDYVELDGEKYYLYTDFNRLTTGEVISIETLMENAKGNIYIVMPELLCLFLRKKKEDGTLERFNTNMMERKLIFMKAPITQIYHVFEFFFYGNGTSINFMKGSINEPQT